QVGIRYDKLPGEWYGPTTAACVLRDISELHAARLSGSRLRKPETSRYVVYIDEVEAAATRRSDNTAAAAAAVGGDGTAAAAAADGGLSPAFFDPLLNPGSGGGRGRAEEAWSSAVVLLVPLRLGLDELSAGYIPSLLEMLRVPQSLGFLGGRPNHAIYFIG
ncbi:unnamed protein product, partial [Laminaria digitata]